ncbi:copper resistance CopC family protein [Microbacterium sp.]|uniref:copper resistance CopC family protein n=1 Tax=Microbacterium sp. TaxID=51671 RepID=UPI003F992781
MRTLSSRRPTAPLALAVTLLAAFIFLFAWPQPASAHDSLVESNPAADSSVQTLPTELTLTFSAALIDGDGSTEIAVTDAAGASVTDGPAVVDGATVTQPLASEADAGEYHVLWKVVSSDGHPTSGEFGFTVTTSTLSSPEPQASPTADETTAPAPAETATAVPAEDPNMESGASFSPGWLIAGAVVLLIVVFLLIVLLRRRKPAEPGSDTPAER